MARTTRTVQTLNRSGVAPAYTAPDNTNGESIPNNGETFLHVKNTGGSACTVTIDVPQTVDGQAAPDRVVTVPATTGDRMIGPFPPGLFNQSDGTISVDYSTATGVTVAAIRLQ